MAFQPFGYYFEVRSPHPPSEVKAIIQSRKKGWFEPQDGARGWIIGPFICLWLSALKRQGPMLFGRISRDSFGTKISGRAGSDLNGLAASAVSIPILAVLLYLIVSAEDYTFQQVAILGGVLLLSPLIFWLAHKDRREAEPLVRFLRDAVTTQGRSLRAKSATVIISKAFSLEVAGETRKGPVTPDAVHDALLGMGAGDFVILASAPAMYIQAVFRDGGYIIERRDGDDQRHFEARRLSTPSAGSSDSVFSFEEVRETFLAYASEAPMPPFVRWEAMQFAR